MSQLTTSDIMNIIEHQLKNFNVISPLLCETGLKIGGVPDRITKQFNIVCEKEEDWPNSTIIELSNKIILFFKDINFIQFGQLALPSSVFSCTCVKGNIIFRYLEDVVYDPEYKVLKRIDVFLIK